ncbi:hypothetical protein DACRYDRAFT_106759 [Dacryopinax primogenitus]|uniref:F-box domain-containing protein n=1 Tax=Dacryopinax primogenitus (strain DJM 731) TaxID=1858805 RepID=M5FXH6_DACPD|nr:uncharacterized protein DACRYDRAFT_106759 [Dacryopinax primogenitus]EJU02696.1 hypothetical protein DACRYDRAFT_106759 [Dacryopinax primogenitus]
MPYDSNWLRHLEEERGRLEAQHTELENLRQEGQKEYDMLEEELKSLHETMTRLSNELQMQRDKHADIMTRQVYLIDRNETLSKQLDKIQTTLDDLHIGVLPIQDFPQDILRLIITEGASQNPKFRWTAMGTCRIWRAVASSTPMLWSHVCVHLGDEREDMLEVTRRTFQLGGQSSLDLELRFGPRPYPRNPSQPLHPNPPPSNAWHVSTRPGTWGVSHEVAPSIAPAHDLAWQFNDGVERDISIMNPNYGLACDYIDLIIPNVARCKRLLWWFAVRPSPLFGNWTWDTCWLYRRMRGVSMPYLKELDVSLGGYGLSAQNLVHITLRDCSSWHPLRTTSLTSLELFESQVDLDSILSTLDKQHSLVCLKIFHCRITTTARELGSLEGDPALEQRSTEDNRPPTPTVLRLSMLKEFTFYSNAKYIAGEAHLFRRVRCPNLMRAVMQCKNWEAVMAEVAGFLLGSPLLEDLAMSINSPDSLAIFFQTLTSVKRFEGIGRSYRTELGARFLTAASVPGTLPRLNQLGLDSPAPAADFLSWVRWRQESDLQPLTTFRGCLTVLTEDGESDEWADDRWIDGLTELGVELLDESWGFQSN